jgi:hypothetical protein
VGAFQFQLNRGGTCFRFGYRALHYSQCDARPLTLGDTASSVQARLLSHTLR